MADNNFKIESDEKELLIEAKEEQVFVGEEISNIAIDDVASFSVRVAEPDAVSITMQEVSGVPSGTRIVSNHTASDPNQHTIGAITGLREELDNIKSLKTIYSDKHNIANYYEWKDASRASDGCFVSIVDDVKIQICEGSDIFGVSVDVAGFVGGQSAYARGDNYGLVVTSGLVDVRCESDVDVGDCVVSDASGYAKKSASNYGYKVLAKETKDGVEYAVISLGVQADVADAIGTELIAVKSRVQTNETNIYSATNVATQAFQKSSEAAIVSEGAVKSALEAVLRAENAEANIDNINTTVTNAQIVATQAKAIAESAATSAESMMNEAVEKANDALEQTVASREHFQSLADTMSDELQTVKDDLIKLEGGMNDYKEEVNDTYVSRTDFTAFQGENALAIAAVKKEASDTYATITSVAELKTNTSDAIAGLRTEAEKTYATQTALVQLKTDTTDAISASENKATATYATKTDITSFQSETNTAMARIEQKADANSAYIQSTVANLDRYSVGPHSQAYGFTLEQAGNVLEKSTIYVPTEEVTETYSYGDAQTYTRTFLPGYLYQWGELENYPYGWITVDKNYSPINEFNTAAQSVYFQAHNKPEINENDTYGYWYTNGDTLTGTAVGYDTYTLYKWDKYETKDENGNDITDWHWVAVATLAGNSSNRAVSQIRQDANSISLEVTNARGSAASLNARINDAESNIQMMATWQDEFAVGGKNYILDSANKSVSGLGSTAGSNCEYRALNVGQSYMDIADGTDVVISFDLEMTVNAKNPSLQVYNTNNKGPKTIISQSLRFTASVGDTIKRRCSVKTTVRDRPKAEVTDDDNNYIEFYSTYGTSNWFKITKVKLETGTVATDWTPAPEDVDKSIAGVKATADATSASVTTIAQNIGENGEVTAATIVAAVNNGKSSINLDADHINFEAENYTIRADKIDFEGSEFSVKITDEINSAVESIEVGGTNLLQGTKNFDLEKWNNVGAYTFETDADGFTVARKSVSNYTSGEYSLYSPSISVSNGDQLTLSFWMKVEELYDEQTAPNGWNPKGIFMILQMFDESGARIGYHDCRVDNHSTLHLTMRPTELSTEWTYYTMTFNVGDPFLFALPAHGSVENFKNVKKFNVRTYLTQNGSLSFKKFKLEKGNNATDWTPAPEDQVSTNNIVAMINASKEGVQISGDKVEITGNTVFRGLTTPESNYTMINGGNIDATNLKVAAANITGTLTIGQMDPTVATQTDVNNAKSSAVSEVKSLGYQTQTQVTTITKSTISTTDIMAENLKVKAINVDGTIQANQITTSGLHADYIDVSDDYGAVIFKVNKDTQEVEMQGSKITGALTTNTIGSQQLPGLSGHMHKGTIEYKVGALDYFSTPYETTGYHISQGYTSGESSLTHSSCSIGSRAWDDGKSYESNVSIGAKTDDQCSHIQLRSVHYATDNSLPRSTCSIRASHIDIQADTTGDLYGQWDIHGPITVAGSAELLGDVLIGGNLTVYKGNITGTINGWTSYNGFTTVQTYDGAARRATISNSVESTDGTFLSVTYGSISKADCPFYVDYLGNVKTASGSLVGSDRNIKNSISYIPDSFEQVYDALQPVVYKYNDGTSDRFHIGMIAQDVEQAVLDAGLTTEDFAAVCYNVDKDTGEKNGYTLRYTEFVPLNILEIQKLKRRVTELENKLNELETKGENYGTETNNY